MKKYNIALIATYPQMSKIFMGMVKAFPMNVCNVFASFEDAARIAREMEHKIDAVLSRGGTAEYIRNAIDKPVIAIPITPFDLVPIIHSLDSSVKEVAFIHFKRNIYGLREIEEMYNVHIHEYTFITKEDIQQAVRNAKEKGVQVIIGGEVAVHFAGQYHLKGIEVSAGAEAVQRSLIETQQILEEKEKEKNKNSRLKAAFDALAEGVLVTDESGSVVITNPMAEKLLGKLPAGNILPQVLDEDYRKVRNEKHSEISSVKKMNGSIVTVSHRPVFSGKEVIGVVSTYNDITKIQSLEKKVRHEIYAKGFVAKKRLEDIISSSEKMEKVIKKAEIFAKTNSAVLIEGESGTGKELFAQGIHNASGRYDGPFVAVNCAAIPEDLLESELFGYEAGAFTGAKKEGKQGFFELAHGGTIFLDEIGEISPTLQTRLLRVLQEKEIMRIGADKIIPVDIRVISATNKDLKQMCKAGDFREDLYYRLNVFNLKIPPLRDRAQDYEILTEKFLQKQGVELSKDQYAFVLKVFRQYAWPGNVRELQNMVERICILKDLWGEELAEEEEFLELLSLDKDVTNNYLELHVENQGELKEMLSQVEKMIVEKYLEDYNYDRELVAEKLGIGRTTLWRKQNK